MKTNRSIPASDVMPVLVYPDVSAATEWIACAFGFRERLRIGEGHRSQLTFGHGAIILADESNGRHAPTSHDATHSVTVRVEDAQSHCDTARAAGATIVSEPTDMEFGERQYDALDPWGHQWTFTESIADRAPEEWGGTGVHLT